MVTSADLDLSRLCRRQFGVFSRTQAIEVGVPGRTVDKRVAAGRYRRLHAGVYAEASIPDSFEARALAAQLGIGGEAALARGTAGRLLGLDLPDSVTAGMHLLVRTRTFPRLPDVQVHRTLNLDASDVRALGPLVVTTPARTILDVAGHCGPVALRRAVADAVRRELVTPTSLRHLARRLGRVRGKRKLLALVDELSPLERDCRTELESRFVRLSSGAGLAPTAVNHPVVDAFGRRRVLDAVYLPEMIPVELDSRRAHGTLLDWHDDLRRENAVVLSGWHDFLRFSWDDVTRRPALVLQTLRKALAAAAPRH